MLAPRAYDRVPTAGAMPFTLAIIGRPNVGKSTLFNRLVGKKLALVDDQPGVTRDRREGAGKLADLEFTTVDTAGLEEGDAASLSGRMRAQTEAAIEMADAIFFMIDARSGITPTFSVTNGNFCRVVMTIGVPDFSAAASCVESSSIFCTTPCLCSNW